jgi:glyoxylase-like metal-dependent hydrolase (beta-lactamase superfamily II)
MEIFPLQEGVYRVDQHKHFWPDSAALPDAEKMLQMAIQPFLVKVKGEWILIDAGLDRTSGQDYLLLSLLAEQGVQPEQISKILLSHLHKDHTDGLGYFDASNRFALHFSGAEIFVQQQELEYALAQEGSRSYNAALLQQLAQLPNLRLLDECKGHITPEISFEIAGGHTPFHQVFWIKDGAQTAFYGGDDLPQKRYLDRPVAYKTDYEGKKAMQLRQHWEQQARAEHWSVLLYHDLTTPVVHF